ncbi:MAG: hypothetical protein C0606_13240 [Hyphomicrobiales bacterium]|nr:MAG: hypothetical protein C0606_13240 [Hyphomicrobiales bacterium]
MVSRAWRVAAVGGAAALCLGLAPARADEAEDLAKKAANPVASLISVPIQVNYDRGIGPLDDGFRVTTNVQPVIPFSINEDWNLISRTIIPFVHQENIFPGAGTQTGVGDVMQSFFVSPAQATAGGLTWGLGPVFVLPTASDPLLGSEKWGVGPTGVALVQKGPWTVGVLANHIWSVAGDSKRADVSRSFVQPFLSYTTHSAWSFGLQTEATYDWEADDWSVPIQVNVSKMTTIGRQPVSFSAGVRYWAVSPTGGPEGIGARLGVSFLFPK